MHPDPAFRQDDRPHLETLFGDAAFGMDLASGLLRKHEP